MLNALTHHKLGRAFDGEENERPSVFSPRILRGLEDALTATAFERLSYMAEPLLWQLLRACMEPIDDQAPLPEEVPPGEPAWYFWPSLRPGDGGLNARRVEPDVVMHWPGFGVFVFEAKHHGVQSAGQWLEEIRAVSAHPPWKDTPILLVAVGGWSTGGLPSRPAPSDMKEIAPPPRLFGLRWETLCETVGGLAERTRPAAPHPSSVTACASAGSRHVQRLLTDLEEGLSTFGYRRMLYFQSLPVTPLPDTGIVHIWRT